MFYSAESALRWAGEVRSTQIYKAPSINKLCGKTPRSTQNDILIGLTAEDRHRQADNIYSMAINIDDPVLQAYLRCKYFDDYDDLSRIVSRVHISLSNQSIDFTMLILAHIGAKIGGREIACKMIRDSLYCGSSKVAEYRSMIYSKMDKIHYQSISEIRDKMSKAGLIAESAEVIC